MRAMRSEKEVLMKRHSVNLNDTGLLFLSLKPRLLKCTTFTTERLPDSEKPYSSRERRHLHALSTTELKRTGKNIKP